MLFYHIGRGDPWDALRNRCGKSRKTQWASHFPKGKSSRKAGLVPWGKPIFMLV
jgi:hypothetical protein